MPQAIALALLGAGLYAGYRWFARAAGDFGATVARAKEELRQQPQGRIEKDLGALEYDSVSGVYRPAKRN